MNTMPIYQMFDVIAQSGVGNLGNTGLIMIQLFLSLFFEVKFLFLSIKNKPVLVQLSVSLIPLVLISSFSIVGGIFFSAFLGKGPRYDEMLAIIDISLSMQCIIEMLFVTFIFFILMIIYSIAYKLTPLQLLMTFGVETLAALVLLVLYGGLLFPNFPYTISDLCKSDIYLARWPIYGYFILIFKCFVLVFSLFIGLILRERCMRPENENEKYIDRRKYYENKTLRYLTKNNVLTGGSFLLFGVASELFFLWNISLEEDTNFNHIDFLITMLPFFILFLFPAAIGGFLLYRAVFPRKSVAYKQLLAMGDKDSVLRLFCEEIVDVPAPKLNLFKNESQIQTEHFLLWQQGIRVKVSWRGDPL